MVRIGITGHMNITPETSRLVYEEIRARLAGVAGVVGVSCVARGADSVFAQAVLDVGGVLEVVVPSRNYRERKVKADHTELFDEFIRRAGSVQVMDFDDAGADAYEAANEVIVGSCDRLIAVWDGLDGERSGTGSVVAMARERGVSVDVIWPAGAARR